MIGSLTKALKKVFGDKAHRDLKEVTPLVEKTNAEFAKLSDLSNDEFRSRTTELKARITERTKANDERVEALRAEIEERADMDIQERETRYQEIDKLEEESVKQMEDDPARDPSRGFRCGEGDRTSLQGERGIARKGDGHGPRAGHEAAG